MKQKYNKNTLAKILTLKEGQKHSINIAQTKELLKCLCDLIKSDMKWLLVLLK